MNKYLLLITMGQGFSSIIFIDREKKERICLGRKNRGMSGRVLESRSKPDSVGERYAKQRRKIFNKHLASA